MKEVKKYKSFLLCGGSFTKFFQNLFLRLVNMISVREYTGCSTETGDYKNNNTLFQHCIYEIIKIQGAAEKLAIMKTTVINSNTAIL
jgi:hypothetical protein